MTSYSSKPFAQKLRFLLRKTGKLGEPAGNGDGISEAPNPRFAACSILHDAAIPYCIWGEDILYAYGVPTVVFDLFLLASDPEKAAAKLIEVGYVGRNPMHGPATSSEGDRIPADESRVFESYDPYMTVVVLLPAKEWFYDLPDRNVGDMAQWKPPLTKLLDSLMAKWFDLDDSDFNLRSHVSIFIGYIYHYVKEVKGPGFEKGLLREHWQLHFDLAAEITGSELDSSRCQQHYRSIRDKIRAGEYKPRSPQPRENFLMAYFQVVPARASLIRI
ncbi:MAG: hypothetical protein M1840_001555 [Geoglossum simile]|nr:MAG: hypothetical protein M1840_001555 [Geoglossum simile]